MRIVSEWSPVALLMSHHLAMTWLKSSSEPYRRASRFRTIFSLRRGRLMHLLSSGALLAADLDPPYSEEPLSGVK